MDEYAPDDWNYERDGRPDIIFWIHNGESAEQIAATLGTRELPGLAEGAPVSVAFDSGLFSDTLQPGCGSAPGGRGNTLLLATCTSERTPGLRLTLDGRTVPCQIIDTDCPLGLPDGR